jgi:hypothetical protein
LPTLRLLAAGSVLGFSVATIGLVCTDRLDHPAPDPVPVMARFPALDPATTGAVAFAPAVPAAKPAPLMTNGFDTERLNALMRGDPILRPARRN